MPIRERTLKEHGWPFVTLQATDTLIHGFLTLGQKGLPPNKTQFVFRNENGYWKLSSVLESVKWLTLLSSTALDTPLHALPFKAPTRIEQVTMAGSGVDLLNWLASRPSSTVLVLNGEQAVGVFTNPVRSDSEGVDRTILNSLHGPLAKLSGDPRIVFNQLTAPTCPHCQVQIFFEYDVAQQVYRCPTCKKTVVLQ